MIFSKLGKRYWFPSCHALLGLVAVMEIHSTVKPVELQDMNFLHPNLQLLIWYYQPWLFEGYRVSFHPFLISSLNCCNLEGSIRQLHLKDFFLHQTACMH